MDISADVNAHAALDARHGVDAYTVAKPYHFRLQDGAMLKDANIVAIAAPLPRRKVFH